MRPVARYSIEMYPRAPLQSTSQNRGSIGTVGRFNDDYQSHRQSLTALPPSSPAKPQAAAYPVFKRNLDQSCSMGVRTNPQPPLRSLMAYAPVQERDVTSIELTNSTATFNIAQVSSVPIQHDIKDYCSRPVSFGASHDVESSNSPISPPDSLATNERFSLLSTLSHCNVIADSTLRSGVVLSSPSSASIQDALSLQDEASIDMYETDSDASSIMGESVDQPISFWDLYQTLAYAIFLNVTTLDDRKQTLNDVADVQIDVARRNVYTELWRVEHALWMYGGGRMREVNEYLRIVGAKDGKHFANLAFCDQVDLDDCVYANRTERTSRGSDVVSCKSSYRLSLKSAKPCLTDESSLNFFDTLSERQSIIDMVASYPHMKPRSFSSSIRSGSSSRLQSLHNSPLLDDETGSNLVNASTLGDSDRTSDLALSHWMRPTSATSRSPFLLEQEGVEWLADEGRPDRLYCTSIIGSVFVRDLRTSLENERDGMVVHRSHPCLNGDVSPGLCDKDDDGVGVGLLADETLMFVDIPSARNSDGALSLCLLEGDTELLQDICAPDRICSVSVRDSTDGSYLGDASFECESPRLVSRFSGNAMDGLKSVCGFNAGLRSDGYRLVAARSEECQQFRGECLSSDVDNGLPSCLKTGPVSSRSLQKQTWKAGNGLKKQDWSDHVDTLNFQKRKVNRCRHVEDSVRGSSVFDIANEDAARGPQLVDSKRIVDELFDAICADVPSLDRKSISQEKASKPVSNASKTKAFLPTIMRRVGDFFSPSSKRRHESTVDTSDVVVNRETDKVNVDLDLIAPYGPKDATRNKTLPIITRRSDGFFSIESIQRYDSEEHLATTDTLCREVFENNAKVTFVKEDDGLNANLEEIPRLEHAAESIDGGGKDSRTGMNFGGPRKKGKVLRTLCQSMRGFGKMTGAIIGGILYGIRSSEARRG